MKRRCFRKCSMKGIVHCFSSYLFIQYIYIYFVSLCIVLAHIYYIYVYNQETRVNIERHAEIGGSLT